MGRISLSQCCKMRLFEWFSNTMESCNAKSCVNNTNEHWIYTCSFTHLEGGQGNVKECGLHFGYSWGTLTGRWCESPVFHWCRSHTVQPCNHKTPKIDISTSFLKCTSKWQENCFILSTYKRLKKWLAHFLCLPKCLNESFQKDAHNGWKLTESCILI